jgi:DMSO reductase anchor subunit
VLGLRHSWLSREIVVFGLFAALACVYSAAVVVPVNRQADWPLPQQWISYLAGSVVSVGALAVFCSVMIYASVRRDFWDFSRTITRFALTSALLGLATLWLSLAALALIQPTESHLALVASVGPTICYSLMIVTTVKLGWEAMLLRHLLSRVMTPLKRSALLMIRDLANPALARFAVGALGGLVAPALLLSQFSTLTLDNAQLQLGVATLLLFGASLAGELLERYLFFAAVAAPRMPGGIR